jgi:hypothetical protein
VLLTHSGLSREAQLLVLTAGGAANEAPLRELLDKDLDWPRLGTLVKREGATPIVWQWLQRIGFRRMPAAVESAWRRLAMVAEFQSAHLEHRLHDAVELLATRGIDVMLLKGSALAHTTYASFADRPMGDVDLLLRRDRAQEAWTLLQRHGWAWPSTHWPTELYAGHQHLPPLLDTRGDGVRLELHVDLLPGGHPFDLAGDGLWADATRVSLHGGQSALVPAPIRQLLHLCIHFAWSHMMEWGSWRTLRDVDRLTRRHAVAWDGFTTLAHETRGATCCYWTLRLARNLGDAPIPDGVLRTLRPPLPAFVLDRLERHYTRQLFPSEGRCPSATLDRQLWQLGIAPRWSNHGSARPWQGEGAWPDAPGDPAVATGWPGRLQHRALQVASCLGYLVQTVSTA